MNDPALSRSLADRLLLIRRVSAALSLAVPLREALAYAVERSRDPGFAARWSESLTTACGTPGSRLPAGGMDGVHSASEARLLEAGIVGGQLDVGLDLAAALLDGQRRGGTEPALFLLRVGTLLKGAVSTLDSVRAAGADAASDAYREVSVTLAEGVARGASLEGPLRAAAALFPPGLADGVARAEQSGDLSLPFLKLVPRMAPAPPLPADPEDVTFLREAGRRLGDPHRAEGLLAALTR